MKFTNMKYNESLHWIFIPLCYIKTSEFSRYTLLNVTQNLIIAIAGKQ